MVIGADETRCVLRSLLDVTTCDTMSAGGGQSRHGDDGVLVRYEGIGPDVWGLQGRQRARWWFAVCEVNEEIRDVRGHLLCPDG